MAEKKLSYRLPTMHGAAMTIQRFREARTGLQSYRQVARARARRIVAFAAFRGISTR
jgi:hypothetical protein